MKTIKKTVELKGYRDGLHLIIDPQMPINQIESAIIKRLANIGDSLSGMQINLDIGGRELEKEPTEEFEEEVSVNLKVSNSHLSLLR